VHATRAAIKDHGGKVPQQIGAIESALSDLEKVMKGEDRDAIESRMTALEQAAQPLAAAAAGGGAGPGAPGAGPQGGGQAPKDDVVDAEFTEVKDDK